MHSSLFHPLFIFAVFFTSIMSTKQKITTRSTSLEFNFADELRRFLDDSNNQEMLQRVLCGTMFQELRQEIRSLKDELEQRDHKIKSLEANVALLETQNDTLEQYTRRNSVRIAGLTEDENENCEEKVLSVFNEKMAISPPITLDHIDRTHRVGKKTDGKTRQIIVKLTAYRHRSRVMAKRKELQRTKREA